MEPTPGAKNVYEDVHTVDPAALNEALTGTRPQDIERHNTEAAYYHRTPDLERDREEIAVAQHPVSEPVAANLEDHRATLGRDPDVDGDGDVDLVGGSGSDSVHEDSGLLGGTGGDPDATGLDQLGGSNEPVSSQGGANYPGGVVPVAPYAAERTDETKPLTTTDVAGTDTGVEDDDELHEADSSPALSDVGDDSPKATLPADEDRDLNALGGADNPA